MTLLTASQKNYAASVSVDNLFSLVIEERSVGMAIHMNVFSQTVNTRDIPWTYPFLQEHLPSILLSACYNEEHLPFALEVKRTELGHLFEHILLEYLCQEKLLNGYDEAVFSGRTKWNWVKEPVGLFHIVIDVKQPDRNFLPFALEKSIQLMKSFITYDPTQQNPTSFSSPHSHLPSQATIT